jgi:hypothetical protein
LRLGLLAFGILALAVGCSGGAEPTASDTRVAVATATPAVQATPAPVPTRPPGETSVTGLFSEPRPVSPTSTSSLPPRPASAFQPWDGASTMLYDVIARTELNLGPGSPGVFSPDGSKFAWVAGAAYPAPGEVWLMEIATAERRSLGPGRAPQFYDNNRLAVLQPNANLVDVIDLTNNQRSHPSPPVQGEFIQLLLDGTALVRTLYPPSQLVSSYTVRFADGRRLLEFEAHVAAPAGPGEIVLATEPRNGMTNIFIVDVRRGAAEFVATSSWTPPNWPLGASADFVVWTEGYCGPGEGKTRFLDRASGAITELNAGLWVTMTPGGLIGVGEFGPAALIDPRTLQYVAVLPSRAGTNNPPIDVRWSLDFRYASIGQTLGHGGLCGP